MNRHKEKKCLDTSLKIGFKKSVNNYRNVR